MGVAVRSVLVTKRGCDFWASVPVFLCLFEGIAFVNIITSGVAVMQIWQIKVYRSGGIMRGTIRMCCPGETELRVAIPIRGRDLEETSTSVRRSGRGFHFTQKTMKSFPGIFEWKIRLWP